MLQALALALSFSLPFSLFAQSEQQVIEAQIREARQITDQWMRRQPDGVTRRDIFDGQIERASYIVSGIPSFAREVNPRGVVYRHYTGNHTGIILETGQLKTGIVPYVTIQRGFGRDSYEDLTGIFLTYPQTPPERVGLPANPNADYIDFTLFEGTPVVELEKEILVIPGRPDIPAWMKPLYEEYLRTGRTATQYVETFKRIDARGGVNPTFMKINIRSYRLNGKVYSM
jgi:hypothetical protein